MQEGKNPLEDILLKSDNFLASNFTNRNMNFNNFYLTSKEFIKNNLMPVINSNKFLIFIVKYKIKFS